ncbi:MAG: UMP kinase [Spirochaetaceae bacterium]|jgi:uridylate kinase|nr:UMP kinase [Spirochaetaceae bacterium]
MVTVISLGGSLVAPDTVDEAFVRDFAALIGALLERDAERRFVFVVGGGGPARAWQRAYHAVAADSYSPEEADWIGVMATRLNARLVRAVFAPWCAHDVITDPTEAPDFAVQERVLVAAGWKPGFSSDFDAVLLAEKFCADQVINLSNIAQVYTDDPKTNPNAAPLDTVSWEAFRALVGEEWVPGKNAPFDPVAAKRGAALGLRVICAAGRDIQNLTMLLEGKPFKGTVIGP